MSGVRVLGVILVSALVGLAGCGREVPGTAVRSPRAAPWDPCSLPDEVIAQAGLDPASRDSSLVDAVGEQSCEWRNDDISVTLTAIAGATIEQLRSGPGNYDFRELTVGDRSVVTYRDTGDRTGSYCFLVVPVKAAGVVIMQVSRTAFAEDATPMCVWAEHVGEVVVAAIPH